MDDTHPPPLPPSECDRSWAIAIQAGGLVGLLMPMVGNWLLPMVLWLIKRPESRYLDAIGKEAMNFQLTYTLLGVIVSMVTFATCGLGFILYFPVGICWLVFNIIAVVETSNGTFRKYFGIIRFLR
jgi:uncharacterized Tic20 family protein